MSLSESWKRHRSDDRSPCMMTGLILFVGWVADPTEGMEEESVASTLVCRFVFEPCLAALAFKAYATSNSTALCWFVFCRLALSRQMFFPSHNRFSHRKTPKTILSDD